jgi:hypothetical protein
MLLMIAKKRDATGSVCENAEMKVNGNARVFTSKSENLK